MDISLLIKGLLIAGALIVAIGTSVGLIKIKKQDGPVEEAIEVVIKQQTGIDIDLTPESPE